MRVALITRRFWPLVGGAERVMASLADEFINLGHDPVIVTAQWDRHWPQEIEHLGAPVYRLPQPQIRGWGTIRYLWSLTKWLKEQQPRLDGVIVSMLKHDAYATLGLLREKLPIILRAEGAGPTGDCHWQRTARFGTRIKLRCESASMLVAPSEEIAQELREAGYAARKVQYIPNGVAIPDFRTPERRLVARAILAEANPDLRVSEQTPVAVYTGRLHSAKGLHDLVRAWRSVIGQWPDARLWLVGEGPERDALYDRLRDHELKYHVAMPGAFDDVTELLYAADLMVLPSYQEGMSLSLLEAMAVGLPVVATDISGNQALISHERHGLLVPPRNIPALSAAIAQTLQNAIAASTRALRARERVIAEFSARRMAEQHLELLK